MGNKSQYKSLSEWKRSKPLDYMSARKRGFIDKLCEHFGWDNDVIDYRKAPSGYWTKDKCIEDALGHSSRKSWKDSSGGFLAAKRNGWLDECTAHMTQLVKPIGYWTKEKCVEEALKYSTPNDWRIGSGSSYGIARKNGWNDECTAHMKYIVRPRSYWTKETCIEEAKKHTSKTKWRDGNRTSYNIARENNWMDECLVHLQGKSY
jgi:hypothetical protein